MPQYYVQPNGTAHKVGYLTGSVEKGTVKVEAPNAKAASKQVHAPNNRYAAVHGSATGHCCFDGSVVDFSLGDEDKDYYSAKSVAETFEYDTAVKIADMFNELD